jgi:hypothetical protein
LIERAAAFIVAGINEASITIGRFWAEMIDDRRNRG